VSYAVLYYLLYDNFEGREMKQSLATNRALMFRASLETLRYSSTALIEFLDAVIANASDAVIDQKMDALGGGDEHLIEVLDDAIETATTERNYYVEEAGLSRGEATYKVKESQ
jgi:hypothetical protein